MLKSKNLLTKIIVLLAVLFILIPLIGCLGGGIPEITLTTESANEKDIQNTISVSGSGSIKTVPDQVMVDISIVTEKPTTQEAVDENSKISDQVISAIEKINAEGLTIETIGFDLSPLYDYSNQNKPPKIYAYRVTSTIEVKTSDLKKIGEIIAKATESGATDISSIGFDLTENTKKKAKNDALAKAAKDANDKATAIAESLGLKIDKVSYISEGETTYPSPIVRAYGAGESKAAAEVTPPEIIPREIEVTASVTVVFIFAK
jgi:uncharacterized protein YggE